LSIGNFAPEQKEQIGLQNERQELPSYGVNLHLLLGPAFPRLWLRLAPGINPEMVIKNLHE